MSVEIFFGPKIPEGLASEPLIAALLEDDDTTVGVVPVFEMPEPAPRAPRDDSTPSLSD